MDRDAARERDGRGLARDVVNTTSQAGHPKQKDPAHIGRVFPFTSSAAAECAYASNASSTFPFVSIPTKCTVTAAISGTTPIR